MAGQELTEHDEIRTGPRSSVTLRLPPNHIVTLDRPSLVRLVSVLDNGRRGVEMKHGRARFELDAAGIEHEPTIHTPSSRLAVRG